MGSIFSALYADEDLEVKDEAPPLKDEAPEVKAENEAVCGDDEKVVERAASEGSSDSMGSTVLPASSSSSSIVSEHRVPEKTSPPEARVAVDALLKEDFTETWIQEEYEKVKTIQPAVANHGRVDLMRSLRHGGKFVAVKKMPNGWVSKNHDEFASKHPTSREQPWLDMCVTKYLHSESYPYVCEPLGVYKDNSWTFVVSTLADLGDLFSCLSDVNMFPVPGRKREEIVWPLVKQVLVAVKRLHDMGIAHRDLSPENIVLTRGEDGLVKAKLIDFGMATFGRLGSGAHGKVAFEAPEMHEGGTYDCYLTDTFALGVVIFAIASSDYPWSATRPGQCHIFRFVKHKGLRSFVAQRPVLADKARKLGEALSPELLDLLEGLLEFDPTTRLTLDQTCQCMTDVSEGDSRVTWLKKRSADSDASPFSVPSLIS